jgi:hypothetical protein
MTTATLPSGRLSAAGKRAAKAIYNHGPTKARYTEHFEVDYAKAALDELAHLIDTKTPGIFVEQRAGIDESVEDFHVRPERALAEIAQNADDCQANELRFALRDGPFGRELLCAHDGARVTLRDAVGMTFAYISGKREDARSKGKFGIGLKTIAGMAGSFEVHCHPYHFTVERQHPQWTDPQPDIPDFWQAESGHTLLVLHLHNGYDESGAVDWVREWGTGSMVFLDTLRHIEFADLVEGSLAHLTVEVDTLPTVSLAGMEAPIEVRLVSDAEDSSVVWTTYLTEVIAPPNLSRAHKKRDRTTPVGIAIPRFDAEAQVFAGLPLDENCTLPFSVHGQFDPDSKRAQVRKTPWNEFVIDRVADLACAVLLNLFEAAPATAWPAMPIHDNGAGRDPWTTKQFAKLVREVRHRVASEAVLPGEAGRVAIADVAYEARELEGVVDAGDLIKLAKERVPLAAEHRDPAGSWRHVLADLECGYEVDPETAAEMFDWQDRGARPADWFARLVEAILDDVGWRRDRLIERRRCLLRADGKRITPAGARARGETLARGDDSVPLATKIGLAVRLDGDFITACEARPHAGPWLRKTVGLRDRPTGEHVLERLAGRTSSDPLFLSDERVLALRDEMSRLAAGKLDDLATRIGERIQVRGYEALRGGKPKEMLVTPALAYLPATIDGQGAAGFPQVARKIPGLYWIHSSYAELLKTPRGSRKLASRPLFLALGAHASPRIEAVAETDSLHDEYAAPLRRPLPETQAKAITTRDLPRERINGIRGDHDSRDLVTVLDHITKLTGAERQRAARALVLSIDREWVRRYASRANATAMYGYGWWKERGSIPATWRARVQSTAFLTSESGRKHRPADLVLRSDAYVAVIGEDKASFCKEVREVDISSDVAEALGFDARPRASQIVEQLSKLRAAQAAGSIRPAELAERTTVAYLPLASYCREARSGPTRVAGRDRVDDLRADEILSRFSQGKGLIFAAGSWHKPNEVLRGAAIFGDRHSFVSPDARELWDVLKIAEPSIRDCTDALGALVAESEPPSPQTLTGIYLRIEAELADGRRPRELKKLPLWTGQEWHEARPIYAVTQEGLARSLGRHLAVWSAPCALGALPRFIDATGVTVLDVQSFEPQGIGPGHRAAGGKLRPHFLAALRSFAEMLSKEYPDVHTTSSVTFDEVEAYDLAHSSKLEVLVPLATHDVRAATVDVFASSSLGLIAFRDPDVLGRHEIGGMAIGALFGESWTATLAPLWEIAWQRADPDNLPEKVRLAREQPAVDDPLKTFLESAAGRKAAKAFARDNVDRPAPKSPDEPKPKPPRVPKPPPRRRLRDLSNVTFGAPTVTGDDQPGVRKHRRRRPLKDPPPDKRTPPPPPKEPKGIREYDEKEKETEGYKLLAKALKSLDGSELEDYRDLHNIGSDAIDNLRRFFELKAHEGEIPDEISLTGSEVERALRERDKYFLAVVGGLEVGDVIVRIFAHPLLTLDFVESGSLTLTGVRTKRSIELRPEEPV